MLGGVYFNVPLTKLPNSIRQIPAEAMLGLRLYSNIGVTFTTGFSLGLAGFAVPSFRYFLAAVWSQARRASTKPSRTLSGHR